MTSDASLYNLVIFRNSTNLHVGDPINQACGDIEIFMQRVRHFISLVQRHVMEIFSTQHHGVDDEKEDICNSVSSLKGVHYQKPRF